MALLIEQRGGRTDEVGDDREETFVNLSVGELLAFPAESSGTDP